MNSLKDLARELGAADILERLEKAEAMLNRNYTRVGIIGEPNSGKTTLINGIVGQEVREASIVPSEAPPMRVVFERMDDDRRFDCRQVFNKEWNSADVMIYEMKGGMSHDQDGLSDELDMVFYLSFVGRFMTLADRNNITEALGGIPVQVIATKCDEVAPEHIDAKRNREMKQFANKACERLRLAPPIFADVNSWPSVSKEMRRLLPTQAELIEMRKKHRDEIMLGCKAQLAERVAQLLTEEKEKERQQQGRFEDQRRQEKLAEISGKKVYQEMRLRCSSAGNEVIAQARKGIQDIDAFAKKMVEEGRKCHFDSDFRQRFTTQADSQYGKLLNNASMKLQITFNEIATEALAKKMLDEDEMRALHQKFALPKDQSAGFQFDKSTGKEIPYLLQSAAGVGVVGLVSHLSSASMPLALSLVAASTLVGGATFAYRNTSARKTKGEESIREWVRSCSDELENVLIPQIRELYNIVSDALHALPIKKTASSAPAGPSERIQYLRKLSESLSD